MVIRTIAVNAFKEAIRDKILYNLLIFAVIVIAVSVLLGRLTIGQDQRVIKDIGLASMSLFGVLIATFVGTSLVHKEIRKKTIYNIISKPIHRYEFILGKYSGLLLTVFVNLVIMTAVLFGTLTLHKLLFSQPIQASATEPIGYTSLLKATALIFFELMLVTSIAILLSTISSGSSSLSIFFTLAVYVIGHLTVDLKELGAASKSSLLKGLCSLCYYILPNLENFNIRAQMVRDLSVSGRFIIYAIVYGILYIATVLLISILAMERKEFV
jgi:ABC-type transport system involved in multi-copper enzyme maturation permease subunit